MRSVLEALASIGLTTAPFGLTAIVLATMAAPAVAPAAQEQPERTVVLLQLEEPDQEAAAEEEAPLSPAEEVEAPVPSQRAPISDHGDPVRNSIGLAPNTKKTGSSSKKAPRKKACLPTDDRIQQLGPVRWSIDSALVQSYASPSKAEELAWTAWSTDDSGQVEGFVVKRMRCGALLRQAGLQNGDVVLSVNGNPNTGLLQGFNAWRKLRNEESFRVRVRHRDGSEQLLRYTLI